MKWIRFLVWLFVVMLAFAAVSIVASIAIAAPLRGDRGACEVLGNTVVQAGDMREAGVPWEVARDRLKEMVDAAAKNPESFVTEKSAQEFVMRAFQRLWIEANDPAFVIATRVYNECMLSQQKLMKKKVMI